MSASKNKKKNEKTQLDLFDGNQPVPPAAPAAPVFPGIANREESLSKIVSMAEFKHQQDVKKFYEVAKQATSHLKK